MIREAMDAGIGILAHGDNTVYLSRVSAQHVRAVVRRLVDALAMVHRLDCDLLSDDHKADADKLAARLKGMLEGWPPGVAEAALSIVLHGKES